MGTHAGRPAHEQHRLRSSSSIPTEAVLSLLQYIKTCSDAIDCRLGIFCGAKMKNKRATYVQKDNSRGSLSPCTHRPEVGSLLPGSSRWAWPGLGDEVDRGSWLRTGKRRIHIAELCARCHSEEDNRHIKSNRRNLQAIPYGPEIHLAWASWLQQESHGQVFQHEGSEDGSIPWRHAQILLLQEDLHHRSHELLVSDCCRCRPSGSGMAICWPQILG